MKKEWIVIMDNDTFLSLSRETRERFKRATIHYPEEHDYLMDNDPNYKENYLKKRKNNKILEDIKYNLREKNRK